MDGPLGSQYQQRLCRLLHSLWSCKNFESSGPRGIKPTMIFSASPNGLPYSNNESEHARVTAKRILERRGIHTSSSFVKI